MSYQVLARKWRPQNFKQMVGQEHVLRALIHALESQRLHHAYLFTGTRGVGKTTIGRILAKCLSCDQGITSEPCGECGACTSIVEGRYVDLIEIDAASRTKVEDMRELLENVQYAPTEGRFKIYLIDEVHMLSQSSFNALLKTLEEPPEHVKFLFATTDPQKLPVTILSRCLQFNLKNMSPERIVGHLQYILSEEKVSAQEPALWALARAADGSMRDALSLTDQAIAYGNNVLSEAGVSAMLGTIDQKRVYRILAALVSNNAKAVLDEVASLAEFSPDYQSVLATLISILHRIAIEQAVPGATDNTMGDQTEIKGYAGQLSAEDLQLFYQIALVSRNDLSMHPDPRSGLEMALIRMLAFQLDRPVVEQQELVPSSTETSGGTASVARDQSTIVEPEPALLENVASDCIDASAVVRDSYAGGSELPPVESYQNIPEHNEPADEVAPHADYASEVPSEVPNAADDGLGKKKTELDTSSHKAVSVEMLPEKALPEADSAVLVSSHEAEVVPTEVPSAALSLSARSAEVSGLMQGASWPEQALKVDVSGMTQNLLFNMAVVEQGDARVMHVESGHYRLLNANHEKRIVEAVQSFFDDDREVRFSDGLLAGQETPMMWRARRAAELLSLAKQEVVQDPNVQKLIEAFDAVVIEGSIKALGDLV